MRQFYKTYHFLFDRLSINHCLLLTPIALMYGFSSQATFTRIFKKHFNTTPAKFREHGELPDTRRFMSCENS